MQDNTEEQFQWNLILAKSLICLFSESDKIKIRMWIAKLMRMEVHNSETMCLRHDYMRALLMTLRNGQLVKPFNSPPPNENLSAIQAIVPPDVFEEMLKTSDKKQKKKECASVTSEPEPSGLPQPSHPKDFLKMQPSPQKGMICYAAAFSNP